MSERPDVLIFVEHVARELDIACAVRHLAESRRGARVGIASIVRGLDRTLAGPPPAVVALPYGYSARDPGTRQILAVWREAHYVNLAYEQVFQKINLSFKAPRDEFARRVLRQHAWGDFAADFFRSRGVEPDRIFVNGNPSYALYRPPYARYFPGRERLARTHGLDPARRWILVPDNYGAAFYTDEMVKDYISRGYTEGEALAYRRFARESFDEAARWWRSAAEDGPAEVIVRPRPMIPRALFAERCLDGRAPPARFHVLKDGSVREWILAADVVASSYSTTLIEAAVAEKPVYMLEPFAFPDFLLADWYRFVPRIAAAEGFSALARAPIEATWKPLRAWAAGAMLSRGDPIERLADFLVSVGRGERGPASPPPPPQGPAPKPSPKPPPFTLGRILRGVGRRARRFVAADRKPGEGLYDTHEMDRFDSDEIDRRLERWKEALGDAGRNSEFPAPR